MALYVTKLTFHSLEGVTRASPTALLYGDSDWEVARASIFCDLRPVYRTRSTKILVLELGWFDYHRIVSYGALLCSAKIMAKAGNLYAG